MEHNHNPLWMGYVIAIFLIAVGLVLIGLAPAGINFMSFAVIMFFGIMIAVTGAYLIGKTRKMKKTCEKCMEN